jgi:malate synthase
MEDLATDRIYRLMIAQRMRHRERVSVLDEDGRPVPHTPEMISRLFDEELKRILNELPAGTDEAVAARFTQARLLSERMIHNEEFTPA